MRIPESVKYYTMKEYCETIRHYAITIEKIEFLQKSINLKEEILKYVNDDDPDPLMFPVCLIGAVGSATRALDGFHPGKYHFPNWIGGPGESLGKETFITTMKEIWPELGL